MLGCERHAAARTGRPGYHPAVLLRVFVCGSLNRIPWSHRLECDAGRNVELMWLTGRRVPDHKTIAGSRRLNGPALRKACAMFVELCRRIGVLTGAVVAGEGRKFKAVKSEAPNATGSSERAEQQDLPQRQDRQPPCASGSRRGALPRGG